MGLTHILQFCPIARLWGLMANVQHSLGSSGGCDTEQAKGLTVRLDACRM